MTWLCLVVWPATGPGSIRQLGQESIAHVVERTSSRKGEKCLLGPFPDVLSMTTCARALETTQRPAPRLVLLLLSGAKRLPEREKPTIVGQHSSSTVDRYAMDATIH